MFPKTVASSFLILALLVTGCTEQAAPVPGFTYLKKTPRGFDEYRHDRTGIVMVLLPGGTFQMGSPEAEGRGVVERFMKTRLKMPGAPDADEARRTAEAGVAAERPRHEVRLSAFLIAKHEVRQRTWRDVMGDNPSAIRPGGPLERLVDSWLGEKERWLHLPVEGLSWNDCRAFCEKTGLQMPSEAQWEFACRAGTDTPYAVGETIAAGDANFVEVRRKTAVVTAFAPNGFGLHNMHGNVREWCADVFSPTFYAEPAAAGPDPVASEGSDSRIRRGGSWRHDADTCRSASRSWGPPDIGHVDLGFRPVFNVPAK